MICRARGREGSEVDITEGLMRWEDIKISVGYENGNLHWRAYYDI